MSNISVSYINHMGDDNSVVNAARISMDKQADAFTDKQNASLIRYLAVGQSSTQTKKDIEAITNGTLTPEKANELLLHYKTMSTHWTPFAHTSISLRCTAPVPIRTQAFKHKQGLVENEESRRYIVSIPELFIPDGFRTRPDNVKQGSAGPHPESDLYMKIYQEHCKAGIDKYEAMIAQGIAPEQARFILPQGVLVNWVWTGNLYAFANMYNSRTDSHAQVEIQELAHKIGDIIAPLFPVSWDALTNKGDN